MQTKLRGDRWEHALVVFSSLPSAQSQLRVESE